MIRWKMGFWVWYMYPSQDQVVHVQTRFPFAHAGVLWCVSVLFLNGTTSTFICEKIAYFNVVFASSFDIWITKDLPNDSLFC